MNKMARLSMPYSIYDWIKDFFAQHFHCTRYAGECCSVAEVKASIIQGSGLVQRHTSSQHQIRTLWPWAITSSNSRMILIVFPAGNTGSTVVLKPLWALSVLWPSFCQQN